MCSVCPYVVASVCQCLYASNLCLQSLYRCVERACACVDGCVWNSLSVCVSMCVITATISSFLCVFRVCSCVCLKCHLCDCVFV